MWLSPSVGTQAPLAERWVCGGHGSAHKKGALPWTTVVSLAPVSPFWGPQKPLGVHEQDKGQSQ